MPKGSYEVEKQVDKDGATTISLFVFLVAITLALLIGMWLGWKFHYYATYVPPKRVPPGETVTERRRRERDAGQKSKVVQAQCTYSSVRGAAQGRFDFLRRDEDGAWYD